MKTKVIIFVIIVILLISNVVVALEDLSSLNKAIKANSSISDKLGDEGNKVLIGMTKSIFDFVRYAVITFIIIRLFIIFIDFGNAGDNPNLVANIKSKALWLVVGLLFTLNFWSIYSSASLLLSKINLI